MEVKKAGLAAVTPGVTSDKGGECLMLERAPNGGWVVYSVPDGPGEVSKMISAYSETNDLLEALKDEKSELYPVRYEYG